MRAVIFGGSGFIGRHLYLRLKKRGHNVRIVDIVAPSFQHDREDYVRADVRCEISTMPELRGAILYNLAAVHRTPGHLPHEYYATNVTGAINVVDFAIRHDVQRILFTSSISVYGPGEDEKTESTNPAPSSDYGHSKMMAEGVHRLWCQTRRDANLAIVRPAVIFGPYENGNFTRLYRALRRRAFVFPGRRDTIKSCGYVAELLDSFDFAMSQPDTHFLYNFCYPSKLTISDICDAFVRVLHTPRPIGTLPYGFVRAASRTGILLRKLGASTPIHPERIDKLFRSTNIAPSVLVSRNYEFRTTLETALHDWHVETEGRME
jgi:nucleoside-diphosphate-sugar epimerase